MLVVVIIDICRLCGWKCELYSLFGLKLVGNWLVDFIVSVW